MALSALMKALVWILLVILGSTAGQVFVPCFGDACGNVALYLDDSKGPKVILGSQNITSPKEWRNGESDIVEPVNKEDNEVHHSVETSVFRDESMYNPSKGKNENEDLWNAWLRQTTTKISMQGFFRPKHRLSTTTENRKQLTENSYKAILNLSGQGYTGTGLKLRLNALPKDERRLVTKLLVENNQVEFLPILVFPVEFEYGLLEFSLSGNVFRYKGHRFFDDATVYELSRLRTLKVLNMSRCGLTVFSVPDLSTLEILDLSDNLLTTLPHSLNRLPGLKQLLLRNNHLRYVAPAADLHSLWNLDLSSNSLRDYCFWEQPLEHLSELAVVRLDNNSLTALPLFPRGSGLRVFLGSNPWLCSCSLVSRILNPSLLILDYEDVVCCVDEDKGQRCMMEEDMSQYQSTHCPKSSRASMIWALLKLSYQRNPDIMAVIYKILGLLTVLSVVALVMKKRRKIARTLQPDQIPYNVLDCTTKDNVSGPRHDIKC